MGLVHGVVCCCSPVYVHQVQTIPPLDVCDICVFCQIESLFRVDYIAPMLNFIENTQPLLTLCVVYNSAVTAANSISVVRAAHKGTEEYFSHSSLLPEISAFVCEQFAILNDSTILHDFVDCLGSVLQVTGQLTIRAVETTGLQVPTNLITEARVEVRGQR